METPKTFLEKNENFVLKLRLVGIGGTAQIRRIRLPRIAVGGDVSYDALVAVAISCTFPDAPLTPEDYDVTFTYYDVDNDCVTIASTEELIDAITQFSDVLRITTDVKRKKSRPIPSTPRRRPSRGDMDESPAPNNGAKQLQNLLESFVGILATAVVALQSHMNPAPSVSDASPVEEAASRASSTPAATVAEESESNTNVQDEASAKKDASEPAVKEEVSRPFIHGRHTCDRCLCTPIIGDRFHATNLPDYDLCGKCMEGYKGEEIQFEHVELDRDRPFQDRWHRKRERFAAAASCRPARAGRNMGGRRASGGPNRRGRFGPPSPGRSARVIRAEQMDDALKEAIRRSLQDVNKASLEETKPTSPVEESKPSAPSEVELTPPAEDDLKAASTETGVKIEKPNHSESFSLDAIGNGFVAEALGQTLDQCADAIDAMVKEMNRSSSEASSTSKEQDSKPAAVNLSGDNAEASADCVMEDDAGSVKAEETVGATILESVGATAADEASLQSEHSEDEWQVVCDDEEKVDDETLARAAQVIGSSLFESDNMSHASSTLSGGADGSFLSSVPTISSDSNVPAPVLDQWAAQLIQLRELGFVDDAAIVDVLERLQAANIGSDSTDEVTVERVVEELFKKG
jgi:hypothetical protein